MIILVTKAFELLMKFHTSLSNNVKLKPWKFLTLFFVMHILSQANQRIPLLLLLPDFHQYTFNIFSISWKRVFEIKKNDIRYDGIDRATILIIIAFPALDNSLLLHS